MSNCTKIREFPAYEQFILLPDRERTKYCVGIPLLNEGERIRTQLADMKEQGLDQIADIIIFDGGSNDGSTDKDYLRSMGIKALLVKTGPGKQGAQFRMGFDFMLNMGYEGIVTIDGNNKDGVEAIPAFIQCLEEGYDFVQGSRFLAGGKHVNTPFSRWFAVRFIHAPWQTLLSGSWQTDTTSAYRAISRKMLENEKLDIFRDIFSGYELLFYMSAKCPRLGKHKEIPVSRCYPAQGKTPTKIKMSGNFGIIGDLFKLTFGHYNSKR